MNLFFSDIFEVKPKVIERYGAFDISLVSDLPLFIDPFLLFNSPKRTYKRLHKGIIRYLAFLRDKAVDTDLDDDTLAALYRFPEVKQIWFGFSVDSNRGSGLGLGFATALRENLNKIFKNFGNEKITKSSHLEKLTLVRGGVGKDNISDFTTNLIRDFLLEYTQRFAQKYIAPRYRRTVTVNKVHFNYETESWERGTYDLPWYANDYILLTPIDMLTKDDTWINKYDLIHDFDSIPDALPNAELRALVNNFFNRALPRRREPKAKDRQKAAIETILKFPELIDAFIRFKEINGHKAVSISSAKVDLSKQLYVNHVRDLVEVLANQSGFYGISGNTYAEAHARVAFLKDVIENKGGHHSFYLKGQSLQREQDLHVMYRLTWFGTSSDITREANDGRGPVDFKASRGSKDKTLVEFKLAKNSALDQNLKHQVKIYQKASDATHPPIKVIVYFSKAELAKTTEILRKLKLTGNKDIVLIDARKDNKPSGSKARDNR